MPLRTSLHRKPASGRWSGRLSRRKEVLSVNMISLPLADFRHVSHIGGGGGEGAAESFGDLSFLKRGHNLLLQSSQSEQNIFLACSPPPKPPRLNLEDSEGTEGSDWSVDGASQKRKKCSSMPLLDSEDVEEVEDGVAALRGKNGVLNSERRPELTESSEKDEDGGFSFSLDLGPSILDDVLQVMDQKPL